MCRIKNMCRIQKKGVKEKSVQNKKYAQGEKNMCQRKKIMLNQTGRKAVKYVLPIFLDRWYDHISFSCATEEQVKNVKT